MLTAVIELEELLRTPVLAGMGSTMKTPKLPVYLLSPLIPGGMLGPAESVFTIHGVQGSQRPPMQDSQQPEHGLLLQVPAGY